MRWMAATVLGLVFVGTATMEAGGSKPMVVRAVEGHADFMNADGQWQRLLVGQILGQGAVVRTAAESKVDLFLGANGPVLRVTENTELGLQKVLVVEDEFDPIVNMRIDFKSDRLQGSVKKCS